MAYWKSAAALAAALAVVAAQPASAAVASIFNGAGQAVTLQLEGRVYALEVNKSVEVEMTARAASGQVTLSDGRSYSVYLNFAGVQTIEDDMDGASLWCVSIGSAMTWIDDADECDFNINGW